MAHLQKAPTLLKHPLGWLAPTIQAVGKELKNAQGISLKSPDFIESDALLRLLTWVKVDSPTGRPYSLSFSRPLCVPPETLRLIRAFADGRLAEFIPQNDKALVGAMEHKGATVFVIKFAFRKNIRNGIILTRPCLCGETSVAAAALRPVHMVWPCIRRRVQAGGPLFHGLTANTSNRQLKAAMTPLSFDQGDLYSSAVRPET